VKEPRPGGSRIHGLAWLAWLAAVLTLTTLTRNPWYLGLALGWLAVVDAVARRQPVMGRTAALWSPLRFGLFVVPVAALFNLATVHVGTTVLARLPQSWPLFGGPLTLEALVYGALNGLALTAIFAAFTVVNRMLPVREIIQLIPRAYYPVAVVAAIGLTFVPATLVQWRQIREAQMVRGHRLAGLRSWLPLWLPLLTGGLERALQLAEAMTARGFAAEDDTPDRRTQAAALVGLPLALGGLLLRTVWGQAVGGLLLVVVGAALVIAAIVVAGRRHPHTRYRPAAWRPVDWAVAVSALVAAALWALPLGLPSQATLAFSPYPRLALPAFSPLMGMATWALLAPAVVWLAAPAR
jgi:energy-coupling factor transport system permease protein